MSDQPRLDPATLGKRVVTRRTELRLEQSDVAERACLSRSYVSRLENGLIANPKVLDLEQIASALGMALPELVAPDEKLVETRYSLSWTEIQQQVENLPPRQAERVLRNFRTIAEIARAADEDDLAQRN